MKTFLLSLAGAFVALVLFIVIGVITLGGLVGMATATDPQPKNMVLSIDLRTPLPDQAPTSGLAAFGGQPGFITLLTQIKAAESDETVKGIFIRGSEFGIGSSRSEELRAALLSFEQSGKFVVASSQGYFGGAGASTLRVLSTAQEVWIQPGSSIFAAGVSFETQFLKGLFDNISVTPEIVALYEYKNAPNSYNEEGYTEPHRRALTELAEDLWLATLEDIAEDRGLTVDAVKATLESGPLSASEYIEAGLADKLGWPEDALDITLSKYGSELVSIEDYVPPTTAVGSPVIAVVGGEGAIITGAGEGDLFSGPAGFASDRIAASILEAGRTPNVRAVIFRVDSGGGSPTASDQIWRAVKRVQGMGKPVIVSMGSAAASGGYYVSTGADEIVANTSTITGSIGIFGGKIAIAEGLSRIGVNIEDISVGGEFADAYGADTFTEVQLNEVRAWLKRGYDRFIALVAEGRDMSVEDIHVRARGRVWSGEDAKALGLVDTIGGFITAIERAKDHANIDPETEVRLAYFPAQKSGLEALDTSFSASTDAARAVSALSALGEHEDLLATLEELSALQRGEARASAPIIRER